VKAQPKKEKQPEAQAPVRPNPLKGTTFDSEKKAALQALQEAKKASQGALLPKDHPAVLRYAAALSAYKAEHEKLRVVESTPQQEGVPKGVRARKHADRSPEPVTTTTTTKSNSLIGRLSSFTRPPTKPKVEGDNMEEDKL